MGEDLIAIVIGGLATARLATLVVYDTILEPVRSRVYRWSPPDDIRHRTDANGVLRDAGWVGTGLSCHRCVGVWIAAALAVSYHVWPDPTALVAGVAAVAQVGNMAIEAVD